MGQHKPREQWMDNREVVRRPVCRKYWCGKCDRDIVANGTKCETCGHRNLKRRRNKK